MKFFIQRAPADVVAADAHRLSEPVVNTIIQASPLPLEAEAVAGYCYWFVGRESWWLCLQGDHWSERRGPEWAACLGDHLGEHWLQWGSVSVHMTSKCGRHQETPFYWTRCLAIDIDHRKTEATPVRHRYERCVAALGPYPVVVSTPRQGLRLLYPLTEPVSVFGFSYTGRPEFPALIPTVLEAAGVTVRPGSVEVYPMPKHTLRLPLAPRTVQLDPETLDPLPRLPRHLEVARLITSMDDLAEHAPLDPFALADRVNSRPPRESRKTKALQPLLRTPAADSATPASSAVPPRIDVERLEHEGLYPGVCRNEAAMALARRRMLGQGWDLERTVGYLMAWTADKTNCLSSEAREIDSPRGAANLEDEYRRICTGIERGLATGKVVGRIQSPYRPITASEASRIFESTQGVETLADRYWTEVFLLCLTGFAKDYGVPAIGPARCTNAVIVHAQVPATVMQTWPRCGGGAYKHRLDWACDAGFTRMVLNYRHSENRALSRARTFELHVDPSSPPALDLQRAALTDVARRGAETSGYRVHPRQVEHALIAVQGFPDGLGPRYGEAADARIRGLVELYAEVRNGTAAVVLNGEAA